MKLLFLSLFPVVASLDNSVGLNHFEAALKNFNDQRANVEGNLANMLPVFGALTGTIGSRRQLTDASCVWSNGKKWGTSTTPMTCMPNQHEDGPLMTAANKHASQPMKDYLKILMKCHNMDTLDNCKADKDCQYSSTDCSVNPTRPSPLSSAQGEIQANLAKGCDLKGTQFELIACDSVQTPSESACKSHDKRCKFAKGGAQESEWSGEDSDICKKNTWTAWDKCEEDRSGSSSSSSSSGMDGICGKEFDFDTKLQNCTTEVVARLLKINATLLQDQEYVKGELYKCIAGKGCPNIVSFESLQSKVTKCEAITDKATCVSDADCHYDETRTKPECGLGRAVFKQQFGFHIGIGDGDCEFLDVMVDSQFCSKYTKTQCSGGCMWSEAKTVPDLDCGKDCDEKDDTCDAKAKDKTTDAGCEFDMMKLYASHPDMSVMMWLGKEVDEKCTAAKSQSACEGVTVDLSAPPVVTTEMTETTAALSTAAVAGGAMQMLTVFSVSCLAFGF